MNSKEKIEYMSVNNLVPFKDHPFKMRDGEEKEQLLASIKEQGTIEPLIVRHSSTAGKYEIVSGHRRLEACKELNIQSLPVIVRDLSDEQAVSMMVDANLHRETILPSERAFAYKMKLEALNHQGVTSVQLGQKHSRKSIADMFGTSETQIQRYIRLTELIPELLNMVDEGRIAMTPAVELSYLTKSQQQALFEEIEYLDATPSLSQAQRLRSLSRQLRLSNDAIYAVMSEEKANQKEQVRFMTEDIRKYFPKNYSNKDMQEAIIKLLENWQRKRERNAREER